MNQTPSFVKFMCFPILCFAHTVLSYHCFFSSYSYVLWIPRIKEAISLEHHYTHDAPTTQTFVKKWTYLTLLEEWIYNPTTQVQILTCVNLGSSSYYFFKSPGGLPHFFPFNLKKTQTSVRHAEEGRPIHRHNEIGRVRRSKEYTSTSATYSWSPF